MPNPHRPRGIYTFFKGTNFQNLTHATQLHTAPIHLHTQHTHTLMHTCMHTYTHTHSHTQSYVRAMGLSKRFLKRERFPRKFSKNWQVEWWTETGSWFQITGACMYSCTHMHAWTGTKTACLVWWKLLSPPCLRFCVDSVSLYMSFLVDKWQMCMGF